MKEVLRKSKKKDVKENKIILLFLLLIIAFTVIDIVINRINIRNNERITESLYTVSESSKEQISKLSNEEQINIYLFDYTEEDYIYDFAKKYHELNNNINVEIKKVNDDEELASQYGIKEGEYNILIISGEKSKLYEDDDLYSYDYNTGDIINLTEQRLTNGIMQVASAIEKYPVYILKGHEKYGINDDMSILKKYIELENYEIKELKLSDNDIPEDCKIIVVTALNSDFSDEETDKIKGYINNGGNILWLEDAIFEEKEFNNANSILEIYGIDKENTGVILEQEKNKNIMQNPYLILPEINIFEEEKINMPSKVMFYYSTKLNFVDDEKSKELNVTKTELLSTSEKALFKTDLSQDAMTKKEGDEENKFTVGAILEKTLEEDKNSKLIIYANNYFVTNQTMTIGKEEIPVVDLYNNKVLIGSSIDYLFEKESNNTLGKVMPRNYYIGIEDESVKQAIIIEIIIFALLAVGIVFIKKRNKK